MGYFATLLVPLLSKYRSQAVRHYKGILWYSGSFSSLLGIFWECEIGYSLAIASQPFGQGPPPPHSVSIEMKIGQRVQCFWDILQPSIGQRANHMKPHEILHLR